MDPFYAKQCYDAGLVNYTTVIDSVPCIGKRADTILIDDVTTESAAKLKDEITNMFLYGDPKKYKYEWFSSKEKEMEIGGNMCHLCGAEMLHTSISRTMVKKHRNVESLQVYTCGTAIFTTWKERDSESFVPEKKKRHIHAECIDCS